MHSARNRPTPQALMPAVISAIAALAVYAVTLRGTYVYDDRAIILSDSRVHLPRLWGQLWTKDYFNGGVDNLYRPIVSTSYAIQWWLHGNQAWAFHLINILLHALCAAAVAEFTRRVLAARAIAQSAATIAGLLFAIHPAHAEAVANIVGRAELMCTLGILAGLIVLCKRPLGYGHVAAAVGFAIFALLCKEQGILQPIFWGLFFAVLPSRGVSSKSSVISAPAAASPQPNNGDAAAKIAIHCESESRPPSNPETPALTQPGSDPEKQVLKILLLVICWTWAIYIVGREHFLKFEWERSFLDPATQPMLNSQGIDRVLMPVVLLGRYTALLVWPAHLSPDYGAEVIGSVVRRGDPYLWVGILTAVVWLAAVIWTWQTGRRFILFCLLCLALSLGIVGNVFALIGTIFGERLVYLPSAFFLMIVGVALANIPRVPRTIVLIALVTLGSLRTVTTAGDWNRPVVLFEHALAAQPKSLQLRFLLAEQYHARSDDDAATKILADACEMYPGYWQAWTDRADQAINIGDIPDAEKYLKRALKLQANPRLLAVQGRLADLKAAKGRTGPVR